ncbi:unnamed protein product [Clavelina lepadiformis]|uniref:TLC domain-containing protein n=1 Tax=Clavelina lepadiformis TaxID=159417 RepID=A0ABP0GCY7_CLALP
MTGIIQQHTQLFHLPSAVQLLFMMRKLTMTPCDAVFMLLYLPTTLDGYWGSLLHHFCMLVTYGTALVYSVYVHFCIARTIAEFSTPFVNTRWMLYKCKQQNSKVYLVNGIMMALAFLIFRILAMPYCYGRMYEQYYYHPIDFARLGIFPLLLVFAIIVDFLNIFWFKKIMKGIMKYMMVPNLKSKET